MVTVTRVLADRIAGVAQLLKSDDMPDEALRRLTDLGVELVPGCTAAAVTVAAGSQALTFAASDPRIDELHRQFDGEFLNRDLYARLDPMFAGYFVSPTIEIYARNDARPAPQRSD